MTDDAIERAFRGHPSFESGGESEDEFGYTGTAFDATVTVGDSTATDLDPTESERRYTVAVHAPTIDAVVAGETVAEVVADGWFETLERRLDDTHTVAQAERATEPEIERLGEEVQVRVTVASADPEQAVADAQAIADYVEGTWVQGIIPGYDYREPASGLLEQATQQYDQA